MHPQIKAAFFLSAGWECHYLFALSVPGHGSLFMKYQSLEKISSLSALIMY